MGFFETIVEYFQRLWDFLSNMVSMLFNAIIMLITGLSGMQVIVQYMPAVIGSGVLVAMAVLIVRFLCLK